MFLFKSTLTGRSALISFCLLIAIIFAIPTPAHAVKVKLNEQSYKGNQQTITFRGKVYDQLEIETDDVSNGELRELSDQISYMTPAGSLIWSEILIRPWGKPLDYTPSRDKSKSL